MAALLPTPDDGLDAELRNVAVPDGMLARLTQIATLSDEQLDDKLRAVPLPMGLLARLSARSHLPAHPPRWHKLAMAASIFLMVAASYSAWMAVLMQSAYQPSRQYSHLNWLNSFLPTQAVEVTARMEYVRIDGGDGMLAQLDDPRSRQHAAPAIELAAVADEPAAPALASPLASLGIGSADGGRSLLLGADRFGSTVLGAMRYEDELPELHKLPGLVPRGIEPPRSPAFDLAFLINTRFQPVVVPALARELTVSQVPLGIGAESYDLARRFLDDGELPPAELVRTEEFLAAVDYRLPSPGQRKLALHLAGGPSPLGGAALRMLQVGVRAGELEDPKRPAAHLIVAVDVSRSMQRGGRLRLVQTALTELVDRLKPHDRLSLVTFSEQARVVIEDAGSADSRDLAAAVASLRPQSGTNVAAGLQAAYEVAADWSSVLNEADDGRTERVVLISDGLSELDAATAARIAAALSYASTEVARLAVIDVSREPAADLRLADLAKAGGGRVSRAATADDIRWALLESLTGQRQMVAADVALSVTFNPKSVLGYRLLGHEATLLAAQPQADLRAGQSGMGLYELQLKPQGEELVATAKVSWRDPATGQTRSLSQRINRSSFAATFAAEPASLQLATLAAETAELLRRSPFREVNAYGALKDLAAEATSTARQSRSYEELLSVIREAPRSKPASSNSRRAWSGLRSR